MLDDFLKAAKLATSFLESGKKKDAALANRTADILKAVQVAIKGLGQEAQTLHEQLISSNGS
jgi:hypothetical protein